MTTIAETPQELIVAAVALAAPSRTSALATDSPELLRVLGRRLRSCYQRAAQVAPWYFGARVDQALAAATGTLPAGWARPSGALRVLRLEATATTRDATTAPIAAGTTIALPPYDDRAAFAGDPAVYELGQRFIPAGNVGDPASGALSVLYAADAVVPQTLSETLDASWPRAHNDVLIYELGIYLAAKDGRDADVAQFTRELEEAQALFDAALSTASLQRAARFIPLEEFVPQVPVANA